MELEGIFLKDKAIAVVEKCVDHYMTYTVEGERFGDVIDRIGIDALRLKVLDLSQGTNSWTALN